MAKTKTRLNLLATAHQTYFTLFTMASCICTPHAIPHKGFHRMHQLKTHSVVMRTPWATN